MSTLITVNDFVPGAAYVYENGADDRNEYYFIVAVESTRDEAKVCITYVWFRRSRSACTSPIIVSETHPKSTSLSGFISL